MSYIQTYTGKVFYPLNPDPKDIDIEDIAHALSLLCRYAGHTKEFYSVAEHSIVMAELFPEHARIALLHDTAEAYFNDLPRPIKQQIPEFKRREHYLLWMIFETLHEPFNVTTLKTIEKMDKAMLFHEKFHPKIMQGRVEIPWEPEIDSSTSVLYDFKCYPPKLAEVLFLEKFVEVFRDK